MNLLSTVETKPDNLVEDPYVPYYAAIQQGIISNPENMVATLKEPPSITLANGYIPNYRGAGIVSIGGSLAAYDLSSVRFDNERLDITPSSKSAVEHGSGKITQEGGIILGLGEGRIRLAAIAIDTAANPWRARELLQNKLQYVRDSIAIVALGSLDIPEYEITDIASDTGMLKARIRNKYFGF